MAVNQTIKPVIYPVNIEMVRAHLRVDDSIEDPLLQLYLSAAIQYVEDYTRLALAAATYSETFVSWPSDGMLHLTKIPCVSITSITYVDGDGNTQTLDGSSYIADCASKPGRIKLLKTASLSADHPSPITVNYVAGYASQSEIPAAARVLILFLVAHWYANRESVLVGTISKEVEFQTRNLLYILSYPELV